MAQPKKPASESKTYLTIIRYLERSPLMAALLKWALENPERALDSARRTNRRHRERHKEHYRAYQHQYYLLHREELLPKHRESALRSKERRKLSLTNP